MSGCLRDLEVIVLDCQASGATPAYGDLIELGWARGTASELGPVRGHWITPRTGRRVPTAVRELTGWSEACLAEAISEANAWASLQSDVAAVASTRGGAGAPTLIHYARFELPFLRDLHLRLGEAGAFPFDTVCLHAIAARLFPDLPRRNIRALAGYLGHSPELVRRCAGHVEATAFIWRAVVPLLEAAGVARWDELTQWLADAPPATRRTRRSYPLEQERRRALPDRPGVYRFLRRNGDVLYVGKATSLRKRVAGHFKSRGGVTERALELLSQVSDIQVTETPSVLEAALLETDEIKRIDPPYNVQLRGAERRAWFAGRDLFEAVPEPDPEHRVGPMPSQRALIGYAGLVELAAGVEATPPLRALALSVPVAYLPEDALFREGFRAFEAELLGGEGSARRRVDRASRALWQQRGRQELESAVPDAPPDLWDLARVRRRLERTLVGGGLLVRRARLLCLLADGDIAYREARMQAARLLVLAGGEVVGASDLESCAALASVAVRCMRSTFERQAGFDAAAYDRLRVLVTELRRVLDEGGEVVLRFGRREYGGARSARLLAAV